MEIIFSLTVKTSLIFEKQITIFKTVNCFLDLKLFIIAGAFVEICHCRALEFIGSLNLLLKVLEFSYPIAGFDKTGRNSAP
jgi:hypothetical protein